jgi:hypothetical protein
VTGIVIGVTGIVIGVTGIVIGVTGIICLCLVILQATAVLKQSSISQCTAQVVPDFTQALQSIMLCVEG